MRVERQRQRQAYGEEREAGLEGVDSPEVTEKS